MKTIIKRSLFVSLIIWTAVYFIKTFIIWEFTNPFQWLIDIPNYTQEVRVCILFSYLIYQCVSIVFLFEFKSDEYNNINRSS